jgi:hypothetical protein
MQAELGQKEDGSRGLREMAREDSRTKNLRSPNTFGDPCKPIVV